ncbi:hypothetical protein CLIM01_14448 [Colletotrichum limetticola]|uniref:Uncharacterized protein n=1 Tax=Colletotrichum limetticola TaxID=1209924 RepID=A0ABQ9P8H5_9PEZI|nr:hypothetical protein CLIM01_14448 [Colletotrichum limetticola]
MMTAMTCTRRIRRPRTTKRLRRTLSSREPFFLPNLVLTLESRAEDQFLVRVDIRPVQVKLGPRVSQEVRNHE